MFLDHLALVTEGLALLGPRGLWKSERGHLVGSHAQGTAQSVDWNILLSLSVKEASLLVLEIQPEGRLRAGTPPVARSCSQ